MIEGGSAMQQKPVFVSEERFPYFYTVLVTFETVKASSEVKSTVKSKVDSLHERFSHIYPDKKVLEMKTQEGCCAPRS